jgi:hypothetical protein
MNRGRKPTDVEVMSTALATVEDPYGLAELRTHTMDELLSALRREIVYAVVAMGRAGRLLMALKEKTPHGQWETFLDMHYISRHYARGCMKIVELIARYPKAVHLPPGKATERLLQSSMSKIDAVLAELPEAAIKMLTPWDLADLYTAEKNKERTATPPTPLPLDVEIPLDETPFGKAYYKAMDALGVLAAMEISPADRDRIFARGLLAKLGTVWEAVVHHLHPIEEIHRRAEIVIPKKRHAPDEGHP